MSLAVQGSIQERIEARRAMRDLDNFLSYRFNENKKLGLIQDRVHGQVVACLKEIDFQNLNWKSYPSLWWQGSLSLRKIVPYIAAKVPLWEQSLKEDPQRLVMLERQCALLEKTVSKFNLNVMKKNPQGTPLSFANPFKKILQVIASYPAVVGESTQARRIENISYDRLTSAKELASRVKEIIAQPVVTKVPGCSSLQNQEIVFYPLSVIPSTLFKKFSQEPNQLFDPSDNQLRDSHHVLQVTFEDPDFRVLPSMLINAGEKQALSHVYTQGFNTGRNVGYQEAIEKIQTAFSGN